MCSVAIGKPSPPLSLVVLDGRLLFGVFGAKAEPIEDSISMFFIVKELPNVQIGVGIHLDSLAFLFVGLKLAFVDLARFFNLNPPAVPLPAFDFAEVYLPIAFDEFELGTIEEHFDGEIILGEEFIIAKKLAKLLLIKVPGSQDALLLFDSLNSQDFSV